MKVFRLEFDKADAAYYPGDTVTGKVVIKNKKTIKARNIQLLMNGEAVTDFRRIERSARYYEFRSYSFDLRYVTWITYLDMRKTIWEADNGQLINGHHNIPFSFDLPLNCAPSFNGKTGYITYKIHVRLDLVGKKEVKFDKYFIVGERLHPYPIANLNKLERYMTKRCENGFGVVSASVKLAKSGYSPTETMPIIIDLNNQSKSTVVGVKVQLLQKRRYEESNPVTWGGDTRESFYKQRYSATVWTENWNKLNIPAGNGDETTLKLRLPNYVPILKACEIISIEYFLCVEILTNPHMAGFTTDISIVIGSDPTQNNGEQTVVPAGPRVMTWRSNLIDGSPPKIEHLNEKK